MVGKHQGFIALMKKIIPGLVAIHCVIHRLHLVVCNFSAELHQALNAVIKCINKIKARSLNDFFENFVMIMMKILNAFYYTRMYVGSQKVLVLYVSLLLSLRFSDWITLRHRWLIGLSYKTVKKWYRLFDRHFHSHELKWTKNFRVKWSRLLGAKVW